MKNDSDKYYEIKKVRQMEVWKFRKRRTADTKLHSTVL